MNTIQRLVWDLLGYKCCRPVHAHELDKILKDWGEKIQQHQRESVNDMRSQLIAFMAQLKESEEEKERIVNVRIIK